MEELICPECGSTAIDDLDIGKSPPEFTGGFKCLNCGYENFMSVFRQKG